MTKNYTRLELAVGTFVAGACLALLYLSVTLAGVKLGGDERYSISARFSSVGSLKVGDPVRVAGVSVGEVTAIRLVDYVGEASFSIDATLKLPADTIASIQSAGLLGDAYVSLSPGASEKDLAPGGRIMQTEPAISLTELIAKYAFGSPIGEKDGDDEPEPLGSPAKAGTSSNDSVGDELDLSLPGAKAEPAASGSGLAPAAATSQSGAAAPPPADSNAPSADPKKRPRPFSDPLE